MPTEMTIGTTDDVTVRNHDTQVDDHTDVMMVVAVGTSVGDLTVGIGTGLTTTARTTIAGVAETFTTGITMTGMTAGTTGAMSGSIETAAVVPVEAARQGMMTEGTALIVETDATTADLVGLATIAGHGTAVALGDSRVPAAIAGIGIVAGVTINLVGMIAIARMILTAAVERIDPLEATETSARPNLRSTSRCSMPWPGPRIQKTRIRLNRGAGRSRSFE